MKKSTNKKEYETANEKALAEKRKKTRWSLVPWRCFKEVGAIFTDGAAKYTDDGWKYLDTQAYIDALSRHYIAFMSGEMHDQESGYRHLSHIIANCLILLWHLTKEKFDD